MEGSFNVTTGEAVAKSGATPNSELSMDIAKPAEGEMTASIILFPQDMPEKVLLEVRMNDETTRNTCLFRIWRVDMLILIM